METLSENEQAALQLFKQSVLAKFGKQVESIQLFGSKARGDADKHSDLDVLVILQDASGKNRSIISSIASDVLTETGVLISSKKFTPQQINTMEKHNAVFWQTVKPDLTPV